MVTFNDTFQPEYSEEDSKQRDLAHIRNSGPADASTKRVDDKHVMTGVG
jgi:hypothetical protein